MSFKVILTRSAFKTLERLPGETRQRIFEALNAPRQTPSLFRMLDPKKSKGLRRVYRISTGD